MRAVLGDAAFRFGVKLGIAGLLATYLALYLRLDEPTWALFTVFVLMVTPYVGAIMEKSVLRIFGTLIGATLGYVLLGWQQEPLVFLPMVAGILTFCVAMFGQGLWAYGFFLCGLTMIDVMQAGLGDPQMSWHFALARAEEVVLGIMVAVVVQSVLWPRYAQVEFDKMLRTALADLRGLLLPCVEGRFAGDEGKALEEIRKFPVRIAKMRALINFGSKENPDFAARVVVLEEVTDHINRLALSLAAVCKPLTPATHANEELLGRMQALGRALGDGLQMLTGAGTGSPEDGLARIGAAQKELEDFLEQARARGDFAREEAGHLLSLGHHVLALTEIAQAIPALHERMTLLATGRKADFPPAPLRGPSVPNRFWIRLGLKGGLAVAVALLLENWLNPPGGELLAISTWILLVRGPTAPAGRGDWRAFHSALLAILAWAGLGVVLLAVHPFLASYGVMNIVLFALLFLWGYIFYGRNPMTTPMLTGMLMIVGIFGLNAQKPVSFQDIADLSVGMALAVLLSALIRRLIWPSLPQREILYRLRELAKICRRLAGGGGRRELSAQEHARLALIPGEAATRLGLLQWPVVTREDRSRLADYLHSLHRGTLILSVVTGQSAKWTDRVKDDPALAKVAALEENFCTELLKQEAQLEAREAPQAPLAEFEQVLTDGREAMAHLCQTSDAQLSALQWLSLLGFCKRLEEAGEALLQATRLSQQLDWAGLREDRSL